MLFFEFQSEEQQILPEGRETSDRFIYFAITTPAVNDWAKDIFWHAGKNFTLSSVKSQEQPAKKRKLAVADLSDSSEGSDEDPALNFPVTIEGGKASILKVSTAVLKKFYYCFWKFDHISGGQNSKSFFFLIYVHHLLGCHRR